MNDEQLSRAWSVTSAFFLFFALDSWLRTQGLNPVFGSTLPHDQRFAAALFGLLICCVVSFFQLRLANAYAQRNTRRGIERLPIAFFKSLDFSTAEGRQYQKVFFVAFHILPIAAIIHFFHLNMIAEYFTMEECKNGSGAIAYNVWLLPPSYDYTDGYRLGDCSGVTYFPMIEPILITLLFLVVIIANVRFIYSLR